MELMISGAVSIVIGAFLGIVSYVVAHSYEYAVRVDWGGQVNWAVPAFYFSIFLFIAGIILFLVGLVKYTSNTSSSAQNANLGTSCEPLFCVQCSSQLLQGNYICALCHHDNSIDLFLRSAPPESRAADINVLWWYKFGLNKRFPSETKELLSLVQEERRSGKSEEKNKLFLTKFK